MSDAERAPEFELPNVGPGPDPCSLSDLAADNDFVVVFFQRDYHCTNCREQVNRVGKRYDGFRARDAEVVSVLPEPRERAERWRERIDPPYPLLADPDATAGEDYDQPVRFGFLGHWSDFVGRMPLVVVLDARGPEPEVVWTYRSRSTFDRPKTADVLEAIDDAIDRR